MGTTSSSSIPKWSESKYFLIDSKFYDLTTFFDRHPGGREILRESKRHALDATVHFSMHHINFPRAYAILSKYEITDKKLIARCVQMIENERHSNNFFQKQMQSTLEASKLLSLVNATRGNDCKTSGAHSASTASSTASSSASSTASAATPVSCAPSDSKVPEGSNSPSTSSNTDESDESDSSSMARMARMAPIGNALETTQSYGGRSSEDSIFSESDADSTASDSATNSTNSTNSTASANRSNSLDSDKIGKDSNDTFERDAAVCSKSLGALQKDKNGTTDATCTRLSQSCSKTPSEGSKLVSNALQASETSATSATCETSQNDQTSQKPQTMQKSTDWNDSSKVSNGVVAGPHGSGSESKQSVESMQSTQSTQSTQGTQFTEEYLKCQKYCFELPRRGGFYWELREEAWKYFKSTGRNTGPRAFSYALWWALLTLYALSVALNMYLVRKHMESNESNELNGLQTIEHLGWQSYGIYLQTFVISCVSGVILGWLGGYGHQWLHMTAWRRHGHIMDWLGLYSHAFRNEHLLWHHAYTNTMADNHFEGTDPFIVVNPLRPRNWIQKYFTVALVNFVLLVGIYGNYLFNWGLILTGKGQLRWCILIFPTRLAIYCGLAGSVAAGSLMFATETSILSYYYFMIALMNHNQAQTWDLNRIAKARDWGEYQLAVSCDIGYNYSYLKSMLCLWLNYHTVHHLLPTTDLSHHRELQQVLTRVAEKHGLQYNYKSPWKTYLGLLYTTSVATAINEVLNG